MTGHMGALDGKVAVVTGGASGIGLATGRLLAGEGATVVVVDVNEDVGRRVADELGGKFVAAGWERVVATADGIGGLDVAHLNAGTSIGQAVIEELSDEQYRRIMRVNVDGVVFGVRAVVPSMARRGGGAIVVTSSLAGLIPIAFDPVYALTKHAVVGLVRSLVPHLEARGITINAVCPGLTDTPLIGPARTLLEESGFPLIPPADIAAAVLGCVTGRASGQAIVCQAGRPPVPYEFRNVPGPRAEGAEGRLPPEGLRGV